MQISISDKKSCRRRKQRKRYRILTRRKYEKKKRRTRRIKSRRIRKRITNSSSRRRIWKVSRRRRLWRKREKRWKFKCKNGSKFRSFRTPRCQFMALWEFTESFYIFFVPFSPFLKIWDTRMSPFVDMILRTWKVIEKLIAATRAVSR